MCGAKNIEELSVKAEQGIGQEESASSLQWTLLYEMLLKWIDPNNRKLNEDETLLHMHTQTTWPRALLVHRRNICSSSRQAVCTLRILWTDDLSMQDKSTHRG
jgi:hypothetical protein